VPVRPDGGPVLDQPGSNIALDVFVLDQHLGALLEHALRGTGVSPAQYAVYGQLAHGASSPKELLEVLGLRPATLTGYLSAMEARGDLFRTRDAADRRAHRLELTEQGRATRDACRARFRRTMRGITDELGGADAVAELRAALGRLDAAIRRVHDRTRTV
jgi:DNA-binding MarR family transcriptional regulator